MRLENRTRTLVEILLYLSDICPRRLYNEGIAKVLRSEHPGVKAGDHIFASLRKLTRDSSKLATNQMHIAFQQYAILANLQDTNGARDVIILHNELNIPWSAYTGVLGMPGQTAYSGWKEFASPVKGEVAFVSGAAGQFIPLSID